MDIKIILLILVLMICYCNTNTTEPFTKNKKQEHFDRLMDQFNVIFPDRNRNAGGPQFYKFISEMGLTIEEFKLYNQFYCGVSGSPIDPNRTNIVKNISVKTLDGNEIVGSYYHCCWPCLCDIMKYARVEEHTIPLSDGDYTHNVLTIEDPCQNEDDFPQSVTAYQCKGITENGIRTSSGRLIFALLYEALPDDSLEFSINRCQERMNTDPDNLRGGMGDIFVKLAIINQ
jgi:hypothetical protein